MLDAAEREQVLAGWNDTARPLPAVTVPELFAAQAARVPGCGRGGVRGCALSVTGSWMRGRAGWPGTWPGWVPVRRPGRGVMDRGAELVVALLGMLKAGAAYLPVDPRTRRPSGGFMLA